MDISGSVTISEPDPGWPQTFNRHRELVVQTLGSQLIRLHHVGSTALPGVAARPIIDILAEVVSIDGLESQKNVWQKLKFEFSPSTWGIGHRLLIRKAPHEPVHLHIYERNDPQIDHWLKLQEYMKKQPSVCQLYVRMKKSAALESKGNIISYELTKQRFLQQAFVKSCNIWEAPESPSKGLNRFMTKEQVGERIWDSFCLYNQTLFRFSPHCQPLPYPGILAWQSHLKAPCFSPLWRWKFDNKEAAIKTFRFLSKIINHTKVARSALISPFDPFTLVESGLKEIGFKNTEPLQFLLLPIFDYEVFDNSPRTFKRILHSQDLYTWAALLREQTQTSEWHEFYTSLPMQLYGFGQPIEFYILEEEGKPVGSCAIFFHRDSVGLMEVRWKKPEHLKDMVNMVIQRAHALNYPYIHANVENLRAKDFLAAGFVLLFKVNQWELAATHQHF
jgi:GrpB-like predicted nucleotidyltransferase (UPF0157 family)